MTIPQDSHSRKYYRVARQRLEEAELILSRLNLAAAAVYLAGYAIECILKALLLVLTPERERLKMVAALKKDKEFGHNLRGLHLGLIKRGANPPPEVVSKLLFVSSWSAQMRYEPGPGDPDGARKFLTAARAIVTWADKRM